MPCLGLVKQLFWQDLQICGCWLLFPAPLCPKIHGGEDTIFNISLTCPSPTLLKPVLVWKLSQLVPAPKPAPVDICGACTELSWGRTEMLTLPRDPHCSRLHSNYGGQRTFQAPSLHLLSRHSVSAAINQTSCWRQLLIKSSGAPWSSLPFSVHAENPGLFFVLVLRSCCCWSPLLSRGLEEGQCLYKIQPMCVLSAPVHSHSTQWVLGTPIPVLQEEGRGCGW